MFSQSLYTPMRAPLIVFNVVQVSLIEVLPFFSKATLTIMTVPMCTSPKTTTCFSTHGTVHYKLGRPLQCTHQSILIPFLGILLPFTMHKTAHSDFCKSIRI